MAVKNLFFVVAVIHNDIAKIGEPPIEVKNFHVLARTPSQVSSKMMKSLGDQLLFIEEIRLEATNDVDVFPISSCNQLVG